MANVGDVAAFILKERGPMSAMKLQKLVYYSQAWSLVWDDKPLFSERFEAWANGPVAPELYSQHRGLFTVKLENIRGNPDALSGDEKETVEGVLQYYGGMTAQMLSDLTHAEEPWNIARSGVSPGAPSSAEITHAMMAEYYGGLPLDS